MECAAQMHKREISFKLPRTSLALRMASALQTRRNTQRCFDMTRHRCYCRILHVLRATANRTVIVLVAIVRIHGTL